MSNENKSLIQTLADTETAYKILSVMEGMSYEDAMRTLLTASSVLNSHVDDFKKTTLISEEIIENSKSKKLSRLNKAVEATS